MVDLPNDRMPGSTEVPMFRETSSGPMPDTEVWSAIKKGSVRTAKTLPGIGSARFVEGLLFEVSARSSGIYVAAAAAVVIAATGAALLPAKRATGVDPMVALRHE